MKIFLRAVNSASGLFLFCVLIFSPAKAEKINAYDQIAATTFWRELYPTGGWSLYCGYKFAETGNTAKGQTIDIEHIFSTALMIKHKGCQSRMQCRETENLDFNRMEADLHNMYPAWQAVITHRTNFRFGLVIGEDWRFDDCDFEWKTGIVEPRPLARGNIARAMLYMHSRYKIPVDKQSLSLYKVWNRIDPPSKQEKARNDIIERLQGNRNPYIDTPVLADKRKLTMSK